MRFFFSILLILFTLFYNQNSLLAETEYDLLMKEWDNKIAIASQLLKEAEVALKNGDALEGCVQQRKAGDYGIEATESLIKAFQINGSTSDLSNLHAGLNKWKELRDFC